MHALLISKFFLNFILKTFVHKCTLRDFAATKEHSEQII